MEAPLLTPREIYDRLDRYVIGQEAAKRAVAIAAHNHLKRVQARRMRRTTLLKKSNILLIGPTGSGKTICAEFALLRLWSKREQPRAVCIEPFQDMVDLRVQEWRAKFGNLQGGKEIVSLTGESSQDLRLLEKGDLIVCTPTQWHMLSRTWRQRKNIQTIGLLIADEAQQAGGDERGRETAHRLLLQGVSACCDRLRNPRPPPHPAPLLGPPLFAAAGRGGCAVP